MLSEDSPFDFHGPSILFGAISTTSELSESSSMSKTSAEVGSSGQSSQGPALKGLWAGWQYSCTLRLSVSRIGEDWSLLDAFARRLRVKRSMRSSFMLIMNENGLKRDEKRERRREI